jgi:hypothetical protein
MSAIIVWSIDWMQTSTQAINGFTETAINNLNLQINPLVTQTTLPWI